MLKYLVPSISKRDFLLILKSATLGAVIAGLYGVLHDQLTFSISQEYFTKLKFRQFSYADFNLDDRAFVAIVGFLATWWVGFFLGWFLGRRYIPNQTISIANRNIAKGFGIVFVSAILFGIGSIAFGNFVNSNQALLNWAPTLDYYKIIDRMAFIKVAYIHNASYAGALVGLICTFLLVRPNHLSNSSTEHEQISE